MAEATSNVEPVHRIHEHGRAGEGEEIPGQRGDLRVVASTLLDAALDGIATVKVA